MAKLTFGSLLDQIINQAYKDTPQPAREVIGQLIKHILTEEIAKQIDRRQDYTHIFEGEPLKMYRLLEFREGKYIAVLTERQAKRLIEMAEVIRVLPNFRWLNRGGHWIYYSLPKDWHISCLPKRLQAIMDVIAWR